MPSIIDQRLAAEMHKRQIETLVKAEGVAGMVAAGIGDAADRWVQVMATDADISIRLRTGNRIWQSHFMQIAPSIDDQFRRLIGWSHQEQVKAYASVIPRHWFRKVSPEIAVMTNLEDAGRMPIPSRQVTVPGQMVGTLTGADIRADVFTEPIAERAERMSDEEWQRVLAEVVFQPPSRAEVEQMLHTKGPDGISWQGRFEQLSRRITDIDRMSQELIVGFSNGENLQQLKKRALPLVEGIQASAKRIVRTEGLRIAEQVQRRSWDGLGDMMVGAQVLAVLDQNTRPEHAARNGTIYYEQPKGGQNSMAELPMLPDAPNCRCWSTPVLAPPKELENDPEVAAAFQNASGAGIPDPASYDKWFADADPARRMMAVGTRRYRAVEEMLRGLREPEWTDFIDADGQLLTVSKIKSESPAERAERKYEAGEIIRKRGEQVKAIAAKGFVLPGDIGPAAPRPIIPPPAAPPPVVQVPPPPQPAPQPAPAPVPPPAPAPPPQVTPPVTQPALPPGVPQAPAVVTATTPEPIPPAPKTKPPLAKTIKEAKKIAEQFNIADVVDFTGLDVEIANDIIQGISDAVSDFPELRKGLKFIGSSQARNKYITSVRLDEVVQRIKESTGRDPDKATIEYAKKRIAKQIGRVPGDAYAYSTADELAGGISVNAKYGKNAAKMREMLARDVKAGFHPPGCDTVRSVVDHEMAHEIDKLLGLATRREFTDPDLWQIVSGYTRDKIGTDLSLYAKSNPKEVIAEAWAEYKNNPQPREIATRIGRFIESKRTTVASPAVPAAAPQRVTHKIQLPKDPKRVSLDQASSALSQLGYSRAALPQFDLATKKQIWTVVDPSGQVQRLTSDEITNLIYGNSEDPETRAIKEKGTKK